MVVGSLDYPALLTRKDTGTSDLPLLRETTPAQVTPGADSARPLTCAQRTDRPEHSPIGATRPEPWTPLSPAQTAASTVSDGDKIWWPTDGASTVGHQILIQTLLRAAASRSA
jgi:hypothetical protein